jgi:hypothetical protein
MPEIAEVWSQVLPEIRNGVTGVGVWTALNTCRPVTMEDGVLVLGLPHSDHELSGHLKMPSTKRLIEAKVSEAMGQPILSRIIEGTDFSDWELEKRKDAERGRLQAQAMDKLRLELQAKSDWDQVYEQLGRRYAAVSNKSLPQNRARFFEEAVELIADARQNQANYDEAGERKFARCLERLAQYSELPSALVATQVLKKAGEL